MTAPTFKGKKQPIGEDFYQTPDWAIEMILPYVKTGSKVLEPTYGLGAIAKVLEKHGCEVIGTDKYPKEGTDVKQMDFLNIDKDDEILVGVDMIVFNPPFSDKTRFLKKAMELGLPFLLLCPMTLLETEKRYNLIKEHGLSIILLPKRVNYLRGDKEKMGGAWFASSWFMGNHPEFKNQILF
jgi:hypothetical protein